MDLTELLMAAEDIRHHAKALLKFDPGTRRGARAAARHATKIEVVLSGELLNHARSLNRNWERGVEKVLYARAGRRAKGRAAA
jgi:hypothetical protein